MSFLELQHRWLLFSNWCYLWLSHVIYQSLTVCFTSFKMFRYNAHFTWPPEWALQSIPRIKLRCGQKFLFFTKITAIHSNAWVSPAFHPLTDGKCISTLWLSTITNGDGWMFGLYSLQVDPKVKFAPWPMSWLPPGTDHLSPRWPKVNSRIWLAP